MKLVYRTFSSAMIVACAGLLISAPRAHAQWVVDCVNCSTSWSQTLQYAQQVETAANTAQQLETQIQQYRTMLLQGASLPQSEFRQLASNIQQIQSLYNQSAALAGNMSNFDSRFQSQFPGYRTYLQETGTNPDYAQNFYKEWTLQGLDSNRTAMAVAGNNVNEIPSEDRTLSELVNQSQAAKGRL